MEEDIKENANEDKAIKKSFQTAWREKSLKALQKLSAEYVDYISRMLFPFLFALFCIIYSCKYSYG